MGWTDLCLWVTAAVMVLGWGWGFNFLTSSSMGTLCRHGKAISYLSSIPGFSPCVSLSIQFCPGILSHRVHSWSWSPRHPLCTWALKLLGHRVRLLCSHLPAPGTSCFCITGKNEGCRLLPLLTSSSVPKALSWKKRCTGICTVSWRYHGPLLPRQGGVNSCPLWKCKDSPSSLF